MKTRKTGFTLVELLVVISIIAMLLALLVPSLRKAKEISKRVLCSNGLKQVGIGIRMYTDNFDNKLPADYVMFEGKKKKETHPYVLYKFKEGEEYWTKEVTADGRIISKPLRLAWLYEKNYIPDPKVFYCSGNKDKLYRYESYTNPEPWGSLPQEGNYRKPRGFASPDSDENQWVRSGYSYYPTDPTSKKTTWNVGTSTAPIYTPEEPTERFDLLDATIPYMTDSINSRSGLAHKSGMRVSGTKIDLIKPGINCLFKDGHVIFSTTKTIFTDRVWDQWDSPEGSDMPRTINSSEYPKFYYRIFRMVSP